MTDDIITPKVDSGRPQLDLGGKLALVTALERQLSALKDELRVEVGGDLLDDYATDGTSKRELRIGDVKVGDIGVRHGKRKLRATNETAALAWAQLHGYTRESIDFDAIERDHALLDAGGRAVTSDGEIQLSFEFSSGADYITVTGCKDDDIAAALAALPGGVGADPLALLEGGDDDAPER